jgi:serine/threonine-protein kinase
MIGQTLGHYRVLEKIGAGGMGVVYRAHDQHLDREVVLKVLPPGTLADCAARKRFRQEALALSRLNHPNIATVHDFDTQEDVDFLVMEYIPGVTLSNKLAAGPLPVNEVIRLGEQLALGLATAHEQNIVHRDLKPGNLRITPDGRLKILDFGLAKLLRPANEMDITQSVTETPALSGTLPYMAPEVLRGATAEVPADIWAVGAVLYEMATGQRAFSAQVLTALVTEIQLNTPPRPSLLNSKISSRLEEVILKCLEKDPSRRYPSARAVQAGLQSLSAAPEPLVSAPRRKPRARHKRIESLLVLPLTNLSRDPEQEYFADGMTEVLIADLAKLRALKVISRTSAMRYKGTDKSLPQIAEELHVDAVVEGSVLRAGQRVRITAQLIHAATDTHLWAENYERDLQDVLLLQSEIARAIAGEIEVAITAEDSRRLATAKRVNPEAYEACLKGRFHWYRLSREHLDTAAEYYQLALEKDPNYALAYVGIAYVWSSRTDCGFVSPLEALPQAKAAALKALELDDSLAEAHEVVANLKANSDWDWAGAERAFQRALQLSPNSADARFFYGHFLIIVGRPEQGLAEVERALDLDPFNSLFQCFFGWQLLFLHRFDDAVAQLRRILTTEPNLSAAHLGLWGAFHLKRVPAEALAEARTFFTLLGDKETVQAVDRGRGYEEAMHLAAESLAARSRQDYLPALRIARLYAHAGENDQALTWLEKAYAQHEVPMIHLRVAWDWDGLRDEPRFQRLLQRMNFPPISSSVASGPAM